VSTEQNVAAREAVETVISLISDEAAKHPGTGFAEHLLEQLRKIVHPSLWPQPEQVRDATITEGERLSEKTTMAEMSALVHSTVRIIRETDLPPLPGDGSETLDLAMRYAILWQAEEISRLREVPGRTGANLARR